MKIPYVRAFEWDKPVIASLRRWLVDQSLYPIVNITTEKESKALRLNLKRIIKHLEPADLRALCEIARLLYVSRDQADHTASQMQAQSDFIMAIFWKDQNGGAE